MFEFALPEILLLLPLPLLMQFWQRLDKNDAQQAIWLPFLARWQQLPAPALARKAFRFDIRWLPALMWTSLLFAAAQPQIVGEPIAQQRSGRDLMLVVDLSGSMEATDLSLHGREANRLQVLKALMGEFILRRNGDRLGLVLFGEQAYLQAPLTFDRHTVAQFLNESEIGLAGARRTAIGDGLALGIKHLRDSKSERKTLILVTDGANNSGKITPEQATELAQKLGVRVYTIGVGADEMLVRDPLFGTRRVNPSSDLDETALRRIAKATGGRYFRARDEQEMQQIYQTMDAIEPVNSESQWRRPVRPLFFWPLGLCLSLTLLYGLLRAGALPGWRRA